MLSVLVQSRKTSFHHCATVSQLLEGDMSPKNASFTGAEMQPVLNNSHFLICIFRDTTDSRQILNLLWSSVPFYHLFYLPFYHLLKFSNGHTWHTSVTNTLHPPPLRVPLVDINCPIYCTSASVRGSPVLLSLSTHTTWTVPPVGQSVGPTASRPQ